MELSQQSRYVIVPSPVRQVPRRLFSLRVWLLLAMAVAFVVIAISYSIRESNSRADMEHIAPQSVQPPTP